MVKIFTRLAVAFVLLLNVAHAQDFHYSQFYASPLTLNPAMTGVMGDYNYRAGIMYRNQWHSVTPNSYKTPSVSFDINSIAANAVAKGLKSVFKDPTLSAGIYYLNDKAGDGNLTNSQILGSIALQNICGDKKKERKLSYSVGLQLGYTHVSIDYNRLFFESQYVDPIIGFAPYDGTNNHENLNNNLSNGFGYFDFAMGAMMFYKLNEKVNLFGGIAFNHLFGPKQSFKGIKVDPLSGEKNALNDRHEYTLGAKIEMNDKWDLLPSALIQGQTKSLEGLIGTQFKYKMKAVPNNVDMYLGVHYRIGDALIPSVAVGYKSIYCGFSYDVNVSKLNVASNSKGGFELSLIYMGQIGVVRFPPPLMNCPTM